MWWDWTIRPKSFKTSECVEVPEEMIGVFMNCTFVILTKPMPGWCNDDYSVLCTVYTYTGGQEG